MLSPSVQFATVFCENHFVMSMMLGTGAKSSVNLGKLCRTSRFKICWDKLYFRLESSVSQHWPIRRKFLWQLKTEIRLQLETLEKCFLSASLEMSSLNRMNVFPWHFNFIAEHRVEEQSLCENREMRKKMHEYFRARGYLSQFPFNHEYWTSIFCNVSQYFDANGMIR